MWHCSFQTTLFQLCEKEGVQQSSATPLPPPQKKKQTENKCAFLQPARSVHCEFAGSATAEVLICLHRFFCFAFQQTASLRAVPLKRTDPLIKASEMPIIWRNHATFPRQSIVCCQAPLCTEPERAIDLFINSVEAMTEMTERLRQTVGSP